MKKCMSVFTAMLLSLCIVIAPVTTVTAVEDNTTPVNNDENSVASTENNLSVTGTNGFGNLLSEEIADKQAEQQENMGNNIFSVEVENNVANVDFETTENGTLIVGIYDEDGIQMITSASIAVTPEQKNTAVELDSEKMPDYFYIKAFIVDSNTLRPMCTSYESPNYTQEMQEFFAKTTDDFEEEKVLNLDEDKTNNFAVYSDDTKIIAESAEYNQVLSVDDENKVYVIGNIDSSVSSLKTGDVFAQNYGENNILIVKVATISIDGTTATITGQETSLEDVFDYVRIDTVSGISDAESTSSENFTENTQEPKTTSTSAKYKINWRDQSLEINEANEKSRNYQFDENIKYENKYGEGSVTITGSADLSLTLSVKCYVKVGGEKYVELKADYKVYATMDITGALEQKIPICELDFMPVAGVLVHFQPLLVIKLDAKIHAEITITGCVGLVASSTNGLQNITTGPKVEAGAKFDGSIYVGLELEPEIYIIDEDLAKLSLKAELGIEAVAKWGVGTYAPEQTGDIIHTCKSCVDGDINAKWSLSIYARLLDDDDLTWEEPLLGDTYKIDNFYSSDDYHEFGFGECPHKSYKVTVNVTDENGNALSDVTISCNGFSYKTNSAGNTSTYLPGNTYTVSAAKDGYNPATINLTISGEPKKVTFKLTLVGSSQSSSGSSSSSGGSSWGDAQSGIVADTDYYDSNIEIEELAMSLNSDWKNVISNGNTTAGITKNNELYMWGYNSNGQLGNGTTTNSSVPVKIMNNVKSVALGDGHSAAITLNGELYTWGRNSSGQLGDGTTTNSSVPIKIMNNVRSVSLGGSHSAAITKSNELYTWGYNTSGQLFNNQTSNKFIPTKVMDGVKKIHLFKNYTLVIKNDNSLWHSGQIHNSGFPSNTYWTEAKSREKILDNVLFVYSTIHCYNGMAGTYFSYTYAALTSNNDLYTWGSNYNGILGRNGSSNIPIYVMSNVKNFCFGVGHSVAITKNDELYTWGYNKSGQLALGDTENRSIPTKVMDNVKAAFANGYNTYIIAKSYTNDIILNNNDWYVCGESFSNISNPKKIDTSMDILLVSNYSDYYQNSYYYKTSNSIMLSSNGNWYILGTNNYGQLGNSNTTNNAYPQRISIPKSTSTSARTRNENAKMTKTFFDLVPNETYNFYVLKDANATKLLDSGNLYYIAQGQADDDGKLKFDYIPTESYEKAYHFVVAQHRTDLSYAVVTADELTYNAEEQYIKPSVKLDGVYLVEGVDYELTGEYSATEPGEYTATINGIGKYTGKVDFTYTMIPDFVNLSTLNKTQLYLGDTLTITASAAGGEGAYTYSYYFRNTEELYWIPLETDTAETTVEFEPEEIGTYYARIDVTDETGKVTRKAITFTVDSKNLANKSTVSATNIKLGNTLTLYGKAVGGVQPYKYAYYMKDIFSDTWKCLKTYSATEQYNVKFSQAGTYDVCIKVKDLNNTIAKCYFVIEVKPNKLLPEDIEKGVKTEAVAATCTTDGNVEYYLTDGKYYQFKNGSYTEISLNETIIPKTGHNYVYDDNLAATREGHAIVCTHCGDTVIQEHSFNDSDICTVCGYENENVELIDWSRATFEFTDNSNGLYAYTKRMIAPEFTITYDGKDLEEYADYDFTDDSETESKRAGKHTITVFDKNDETNIFSFDYYIYNLGISATETENTDNKIKFTATRNTDKTNVMKFGMVFDRNGTFADNLSLENKTNISTTTNKSTAKYNVNVADSGKGVYARPYIQVTLNGENYIAYGEVQFFTRYTSEQIAVPTIQDIEPQIVNGKVSVKVQKPIYDTELYVCKEMGIIFSKNGTITSLENAQTSNILIYENIGNGNVSKGYVNGAKIGEQSLDNYSSYSANIGFVNGNPVYTRAYVIFTNKNTNEDMVVYGNYFVTNP